MKIFVTGGTGFVGQYLVKRLLELGNEVRCLVRDVAKASALEQMGATLFKADLLDPPMLCGALRGSQVVYHLAGHVYSHNWRELYLVNSLGTKNLYTASFTAGVERFIYLSSIAALGPTKTPAEIHESIQPKPLSKYGKSKLIGENFIRSLRELQRSRKMTTVVIRAPMIYGVRFNRLSRFSVLLMHLKNGSFRFIGRGDNIISLCHITNLVTLLELVLFLNTTDYEVLHVCDDDRMTFKEIVLKICVRLGISTDFSYVDRRLASLIALAGDIMQIFSLETHLLTTERFSELTGNWLISNAKAKSLGYQPTVAFDDGLEETLRDFKPAS